jgi:hypothetical protein
MRALLALALLFALSAGVAAAARLPGVRTPSKNISCFYIPRQSTTQGSLLCGIKQAAYTGALQARCTAPPTGLDWHGFWLTQTGKGEVLCAGGIMHRPQDTPKLVTLAYGSTWRYRGFTCTSRFTGLTCINTAGHGLFLSRESWRAW